MSFNRTSPTHRPGLQRVACAAALSLLLIGCAPARESVETTPIAAELMAADVAQRPVRFIGTQSCAASGCHGQPFDGQTRDWRTAYAVWSSEDPHRRAFEILYTQRSVEMYRNLHPAEPLANGVPLATAYGLFLQKRCLGCHAGPPRGSLTVVRVADGISCEACHGAASRWLDQHYQTSWPTAGDPAEAATRMAKSEEGFRDMADLYPRAGVCSGCHVGPMTAQDAGASGGQRYDVDHDLIAAGHPRLTFEMDAYLANYPKHWNQAADEARHGGSFHVDAWTFGQEHAARQIAARAASSTSDARSPEFASYDCHDCHHAIGPPGDRRASLAGSDGLPRPALLPLVQLLAVSNSRGDEATTTELQATVAQAGNLLRQSWTATQEQPQSVAALLALAKTEGPLVPPCRRADLGRHAAGLRRVPAGWKNASQSHPTWDQAVQFYLAVQALSRDLDEQQRPPLAAAGAALAAALGPHHFAGRAATQYDSPATYDPRLLAEPLKLVDQALEALVNRPPE